MRLHSLEISAFGPFAGTETVDFDALGAGGVFLFTGPTGAGKTSVLDAVCFALYGQVPGSRARAARGLRSDHAAEGVAPRVVLDLSLRGRRLRITRSPAWERPKRRGTGTVSQQAAVHLEELTPSGWTTQATRLDEAGDLIGRLLGLRLQQFCQVVLLPQGQFADFLRADAENRRDLLESLFDTGRFTDVERWLVSRRQESARALDDADRRLDHVLARITESSGQERPETMAADDAARWADDLLAGARTEHARADAVATLASEQVEVAAATLEAAALVAEAHERRAALARRREALAAAQESAARAARELAAARTAAPVLPLVVEVARLRRDLDETRAALTATSGDLVRALAGSGAQPGQGLALDPWPPAEVLSEVARGQRDQAAALRALAKDEAEAERLVEVSRGLERRIVELDDRSRTLRDRLAASPDRRAALSCARDRSAAAHAALPGCVDRRDRAEERLTAARTRDALLLERGRTADRLRSRVDTELAARSAWLEVRQARLDGMAAELAAGLAQGASCPVCGGTDHPRPARPGPRAVTKAAEDRAAAQVRSAERARDEARADLAQVEAALAAATGVAGTEPVADLVAAREAAAGQLEELARAAATAEDDDRALAAFADQHEAWLRDSVALDEEARALRQRIDEDHDTLGRLRAALDAARGPDPSIAARALRLVRAADDVEALARQVEDEQRLTTEVAAALGRAEAAAAEQGLASVEDALRDHRDAAATRRLEQEVAAHAAEAAAVEDQLAEAGLVALSDGPAPDVARLRAALAEAEQVRAEAERVRATTGARAGALARLGSDLTAVLAARAPVLQAHRTVDGLARLAEGKSADNRLRMSLSGYVLAARLEQVALAASDRLARMTSDRYRLVHSDAPSAARVRGGLTLRVLDSWTGVARDPATLSGGETFTASLALALGLADVVTAEAGSALLETLFVDEGFGSLDDESLDDVLGVLDGLREGGRTVGLVSHVPDLRQRVPVQLRVDKGRAGSHVRQ